jgi:enterochelin esterase-like enzyme
MSMPAYRLGEDEMFLELHDRRRSLRAVRLRADLWKRGDSPAFVRRARPTRWELRLPVPTEVDRLEYQLELRYADGSTELVCDPENPLRAPGPFGAKSVLELPGYEPPVWLEDDEAPAGDVERFSIRSRTLRADVEGVLWTSPRAKGGSELPLLVVHDGPEYAEFSLLLRMLESATAELEIRPLRAALLQPVDRNETYSASTRYSHALAHDLVPALTELGPAPDERDGRIGMGASLGALAMLHAHRVHPELFGGLFLQSGSFFRRRTDGQESGFARFGRIARFVGSVHRTDAWPQPVPVVMTCGTGEENLANNRSLREALAAQGYPVRLHEHPDAHNWVSWRDVLHPHLVSLLVRLWG